MSKKTKEKTLAEVKAEKQAAQDVSTANAMAGTEAGKIWDEIKDKDIEMFALPDQKVSMHCHPIMVEPSRLFLTTNSTAVLPSLETAIGKKFTVELADKFVIVARVPAPLFKK